MIPEEDNSRIDEKTSTSPAYLNGNVEVTPISKLRQAIPQFCAVSAKNFVLLTYGTTTGFATIIIPELQKDKPDIDVTLEQLSWISSINLILVPVGCLLSGPISQYLGRKKIMMLTNIPFLIIWLLFHYATNATMLYTAFALTGVIGGLLEAPVLTYVAEVTQPHLRGMLSATSTMSINLGVFTQLLAATLTTWRTVALINIIFLVMSFTALCMVPESPHWLAEHGRLQESERALCWLRGWVTPSHVQKEFHLVCETSRKPTKEKENSRSTGKKEKIWKPYTKRTFYRPFLLVTICFAIGAFGGVLSLQTFAAVIFAKFNAPIDKYTAAVFLGIAELVATIICVFSIHFTGKRKLTFLSTIGTGLCFFFVAIYKYMIDLEKLDGEQYTWIPTTLIIGAAFLSHLGIKLLPWILTGEVFSGKERSSATGAAACIAYIFYFIVNKVFFYMVNGITLAGTFWFYSAVNCIGSLVLYFILPETEGRTLKEIEEHFAGIHNLKDKPKKEELPFKEKWAVNNPTVVNDDMESRL